jgi:hypothetical protein
MPAIESPWVLTNIEAVSGTDRKTVRAAYEAITLNLLDSAVPKTIAVRRRSSVGKCAVIQLASGLEGAV